MKQYLNLASNKDILLIALIIIIVFMMILPLPTLLMDFIIALNISISIIIMLISLHISSPISFSTFPSVLLITTLFRLSISISTTRLILIDGSAGQIIETFGRIVISGNIVVGLVIFLILTIVQFLVITKGADRVAEVSARFSLDGLPGKQMSVDADMRAGFINQIDARNRRQALEQETKLFGSMDGAMKFVKGDAIAGLIITAVNILGGITIGMLQKDMDFSSALEQYSLMTIGDGLVAQIPALLISIAAGTIVTRVTTAESSDLGSDIGNQVISNSRTVIVAGLVIILFGFIPGFPTVIFFLVGAMMSLSVAFSLWKKRKTELSWQDNWYELLAFHEKKCEEEKIIQSSEPSIRLLLPLEITHCKTKQFISLFENTRLSLEKNYGIPTGYWKFEITGQKDCKYHILINNQPMADGTLDMDYAFVRAHESYLNALDIESAKTFRYKNGTMVHKDYIPKLDEASIAWHDPLERMFMHLNNLLENNLSCFVNNKSTERLLEIVSTYNAALVEDIKNNLSIGQISRLLKNLVEEKSSISNIVLILEELNEWAQKDPSPLFVLQKVRVAIGESILKNLAPFGFLPVIVVAPSLEEIMRESQRATQHEAFVVLDSTISESITNQVKSAINEPFRYGEDPVIITQADVRRHMFSILKEWNLSVPVMAYNEVPSHITIYPVSFLFEAS